MSTLLLGSGHQRRKLIHPGDNPHWVGELMTVDYNPDTHPDLLWDLDVTPWPFETHRFQEIHAYEVLEHLGQPGDEKAFFAHFYECWRILKPGGLLCASVPWWQSAWAWGDPSHKRIIPPQQLSFLAQDHYEQCGSTPCSDFRHLMRGPAGDMNFALIHCEQVKEQLFFVLEAR